MTHYGSENVFGANFGCPASPANASNITVIDFTLKAPRDSRDLSEVYRGKCYLVTEEF